MNRKSHVEKPVARKDRLVIQELPDETLVYDLDRDQAHCLNQSAAFVWKKCDGQTSTSVIAESLAAELKVPVDEKVVWLALDQLGRNELLEQQPVPPPMMAGLNRRQMVRAMGIAAAIGIPLVTSIMAPTPASAISCLPSGAACNTNPQCCSGSCIGSPGTCA